MIFDLYISGYSILGIIRELERQGIKSPTNKDRWNKRALEMLLCNEKYTGSVLIGKTYGLGFPSAHRLMNNGERPKFMVSDAHVPIISKEQFQAAQQSKALRSNVTGDGNRKQRKSSHYSMKRIIDDKGSPSAPAQIDE